MPIANASESPLPYGVGDVNPLFRKPQKGGNVRCVVRSCSHWLRPPSRKMGPGEVCPDHGIRVHGGGTYTYEDYRRNLVVDADYFENHIRRNPFKYECHRFGQERSEDAVSWNVFRSLQRAGCLHLVAKLITGIENPSEPRLFLWGLELQADGAEPWDLLLYARDRFERDLPVSRPKTEPDIALFLPGEYLCLIEAKFTSINGVYERDRKTKLFDLTIDQLVKIYQDKSLKILKHDEAGIRDTIHYQLWRNMIFAEWMAMGDGPKTRAYHASLVRQGFEGDVCEEFVTLLNSDFQDRFEQITWEQIYAIATRHRPALNHLCRYFESKTERLERAFKIPVESSAQPPRPIITP